MNGMNHVMEICDFSDSVPSDGLLAIINKGDWRSYKPGLNFITREDQSMQVATMWHQPSYAVKPHRHIREERRIIGTQETVIVMDGLVEIVIYNTKAIEVYREMLNGGDFVTFVNGGHGLFVHRESRLLEIKQGPYLGKDDKVFLFPEPDPN